MEVSSDAGDCRECNEQISVCRTGSERGADGTELAASKGRRATRTGTAATS